MEHKKMNIKRCAFISAMYLLPASAAFGQVDPVARCNELSAHLPKLHEQINNARAANDQKETDILLHSLNIEELEYEDLHCGTGHPYVSAPNSPESTAPGAPVMGAAPGGGSATANGVPASVPNAPTTTDSAPAVVNSSDAPLGGATKSTTDSFVPPPLNAPTNPNAPTREEAPNVLGIPIGSDTSK
jgi:hypothetical protein